MRLSAAAAVCCCWGKTAKVKAQMMGKMRMMKKKRLMFVACVCTHAKRLISNRVEAHAFHSPSYFIHASCPYTYALAHNCFVRIFLLFRIAYTTQYGRSMN